MKLLVEEFSYPEEKISALNLHEDDLKYLTCGGKGEGRKFDCVGYFYPRKANEDGESIPSPIFILPKVVLQPESAQKDARLLLFGRLDPIEAIDCLEKLGLESGVAYQKDERWESEKQFIFHLSIWLYQAIDLYGQRLSNSRSTFNRDIRDLLDSRQSGEQQDDFTYLDLVLQLFKFNKDHQNLFTQLSLTKLGQRHRIDWNRTVRKETAWIIDNRPIYLQTHTHNREINYDEELIVLFYSTLNYLRGKFNFRVVMALNYPLLPEKHIESLIAEERGTRYLKSIRHRYFKDELIKLWHLLYMFYARSQDLSHGRARSEYLVAKDFNNIFEDMIDLILSDDAQELPNDIKAQQDGKRVDHIYRHQSLVTTLNDIYFIGDSKYYKEGNNVEDPSIYKQYTYAKNVIQLFFNHKKKNITKGWDGMRYRDNLTEGYNITPNFFLRGGLDFSTKGDLLQANLESNGENLLRHDDKAQIEPNQQWEDRLFDRDTLLLETYDINFLYVMNAYIHGGDPILRQKLQKRFREDIQKRLEEKYFFLLVKCKKLQAETFVKSYFKELIGKMYRYDEDSWDILLAFEKSKHENEDIRQTVREKYCAPHHFPEPTEFHFN